MLHYGSTLIQFKLCSAGGATVYHPGAWARVAATLLESQHVQGGAHESCGTLSEEGKSVESIAGVAGDLHMPRASHADWATCSKQAQETQLSTASYSPTGRCSAHNSF